MNKILIISFLLSLFFDGNTQNLVSNPSFEQYSSCPTANNLNDGQFDRLEDWWCPTYGTSDYFNVCNNSGSNIVGIPNNFWGHQQAFHGDGYVGLGVIIYNKNNDNYTGEYIQTKLLHPLKECTEYKMRFYINLANESTHGISKIGVHFGSQKIDNSNRQLLNHEPQIENVTSGFLSDTSNWVKIEGIFFANGGEEYLTIGYFYQSFENDTVFIQNDPGFPDFFHSYYYIDSVSLISTGKVKECIKSIPNVITPNNDGVNDNFKINFEYDYLYIYNRWGQLVFENKNQDIFWDGNDINSKSLSDGIYYYIIQSGDEKHTGSVQIIR